MNNKTTAIASENDTLISSLVINGDLSKLTPDQKVSYYRQYCERLGLDSLTQPFKLLKLNGKEVLYCDRSGAQQLNKLHNVSHTISDRQTINGCFVVTAEASTPDGRKTASIGAVWVENLKGDALCNAYMKAETKAKRRATLDLLGLGILDETEADSIPAAQKVPAPGVKQEPTVDATATAVAVTGEKVEVPLLASPFKTKYETVAEVEKVLEDAKDIKDIANLYYINAELVETSAALRATFTEKKNSFYGRQHTSLPA